jgi:biotin transport system substrate-specific component
LDNPPTRQSPLACFPVTQSRGLPAADLARVAVFAGIIAALGLAGRFYVFGSAVPVTLQTLGVMLAGLILGARLGALAVLVYLAIGAAGVPVFAGVGGLAPFAGVTAGYLVAFPIGAFVIGLIAFRDGRFKPSRAFVAAVVGGIGVVYAIGVPVLAVRAGLDLGDAARVGGLIFLPGDLIKAVLATLIATAVHRAYPGLVRANAPEAATSRT